MRVWLVCGCLYLLSCGTGPDDKASYTRATDSSFTHASELPVTNNDLNFAKDEQVTEELPATPPVKKPSGVYRFLLPEENGKKILHTVSFSTTSFRLQEEYSDKRDSIVVTQGTWAPSAGFIWLYRDQVVRGRYSWKGDTLQYYSPRLKKSFAMEKLTSVRVNNVWQTKKAEGVALYAVGTEPFWSVELSRQDSLVLNMPDWNAPLRVKVATASASADSTVYTADNDSLSVTIYPLFCSDGMSDFLYTQKIKLVYKGQTYTGCGERLRRAN
jgi:uncharacterized membrane protein